MANGSASKSSSRTTPVDVHKKARKSWHSYFSGSPVLILSILLHLFFVVIAYVIIVQRIKMERKQNFTSINLQPSSAVHAEHQVEMNKKKDSMTTPTVDQRITTTGLSSVVLPDISLPTDDASSRASSAKMEVTPLTPLNSLGLMKDVVSLDLSSIVSSAFGVTKGNGLGLVGRFYDLKQKQNGDPTGMDVVKYILVLEDFIAKGWPDDYFKDYFTGPKPLYLSQLFIPYMEASEGPKAFHVDKWVKPTMWVVLYKGRIQVPHTGTYRFVGSADDICEVAINKKFVLEGSFFGKMSAAINNKTTDRYQYTVHVPFQNKYFGPEQKFDIPFRCGEWFKFQEDKSYEIEILIGEHPGGYFGAWLMLEDKYHSNYKKTAQGSPILPLFKLSRAKMPPMEMGCPPYDQETDLGWTLDEEGTAADEASSNSGSGGASDGSVAK